MRFSKLRIIKNYFFLVLFLFVSGEYLGNEISKKDSLFNHENILKDCDYILNLQNKSLNKIIKRKIK